MDGHEKLAQPFGLYIYAFMDTFSRKVLALTVLPDKRMETVAKWFFKELKSINGEPIKFSNNALYDMAHTVRETFVVHMNIP